MKIRFLILGMIFSFIVVSCSKKDSGDSTTITADEARVNAKIDVANDDVSKVIEEQFNETLTNAAGRSPETVNSCAIVTRTPAFGIIITPGTAVSKIIDFGTTGCTLPNGNTLKGVILINFTYNPTATSNVVTYTFDNFYHNDKKFIGTRTFTRTFGTSAANPVPHAIVTMDMNMTVTLADGRVLTRVGTRTREIIAGANTINPLDNVYQVTGNWTTTYPNTTVQTSTITSPLIIKVGCLSSTFPIVQGVITYVRNTNTATLDYGDGTCDNLAVFTKNGQAYSIVLGN